jgi:Na+-transporting NADH:ubiquinone oxidoreductase subunit F
MNPMVLVAAIVVFTAIILGLVSILLAAKKALVPEGNVTISINDNPDLAQQVSPGQTLLSAMAAQKIFIPSACGGGGTCAMCKCKVLEGGGDVLPTETGQLTLKERKEGVRLACQVKVKQDMKIELE